MRWYKHTNLLTIFSLVFLTISLRLIPILPNNFPFMFDHAKDSLIIMQMGTQFKPSLIGAVTSIPGVYYGPAWYYLALPLNILMNYHPLASVLTVILLSAATVVLAYKYLGKIAAVWLATSFGLIGTQTSAWSPYLTPLVTLPILIILLQLKRKKPIQLIKLLLLALLTSLSFHFQPAFGIVLTPLVMLILVLLKVKVSLKHAAIGIVVFLLPFTPHLVFELRHDFHQTKQVINFVQHYSEQAIVVQPNQKGLRRISEVGFYMVVTAGKALSTTVGGFSGIGMVAAIVAVYAAIKKKLSPEEIIIFSTFLIGTFVLYLILPIKEYYLVALIPIWVVLFSVVATRNTEMFSRVLITWFIVSGLGQMLQSRDYNRALTHTEAFVLQPKLDAINKVYELADNKPFVVYHFVPELYDYQYQHIYRWLGRQGYSSPVEYSYAPHESAYMEQVVPNLEIPQGSADQIFLIVERPGYEWAFDEWWSRVTSGLEIKEKYPINDAITVYQASVKR